MAATTHNPYQVHTPILSVAPGEAWGAAQLPPPWTYPGSDNPGTLSAGRLLVWLLVAAAIGWAAWAYAHRDTAAQSRAERVREACRGLRQHGPF